MGFSVPKTRVVNTQNLITAHLPLPSAAAVGISSHPDGLEVRSDGLVRESGFGKGFTLALCLASHKYSQRIRRIWAGADNSSPLCPTAVDTVLWVPWHGIVCCLFRTLDSLEQSCCTSGHCCSERFCSWNKLTLLPFDVGELPARLCYPQEQGIHKEEKPNICNPSKSRVCTLGLGSGFSGTSLSFKAVILHCTAGVSDNISGFLLNSCSPSCSAATRAPTPGSQNQ